MKRFLVLILSCLFFCVAVPGILEAQHQAYTPDPDTAIQRRISEWQDLKFGLLMHWGPYSQWGVVESWSICPEDVGWATGARIHKRPGADYFSYVKDYENLQTTFNPVKFDPDRWAAAAQDAGMRYMVFTTKHHDGFCMFDTKTTDYKITSPKTPFSGDPRSNVTKEIFNAFRKKGLWVGAYFSKPDWHSDDYWWHRFPPMDRNPNYDIKRHPEKWEQFARYTHQQIGELMSDYGKVDILWLDGGWVQKRTEEQAKKEMLDGYEENHFAGNPQNQDIDMPGLVREARTKQPGLIVVDRAVTGPYQNYLTPEQHIPDEGLPYPWETCMTMGGSWSFVPNDIYKPADELIKKLVDIVSKGGNYLLNIGPGPDGEWSDTAYARLKEIGRWMKTNSGAIYDTRPWTVFGEGPGIRFARSKDGHTKYIYLFTYPDSKVVISGMAAGRKATLHLLGSTRKLKWKQTNNGLEIILPPPLRLVSDHVWVIRIKE